MRWYLEGIRGLYFGFYRGFFREKRRPQSTCLSADVEDEVAEIMQFLAYGELVDIFKVADSMTSLYYDNKQGCAYGDIAVVVKAICDDDADPYSCSVGRIFNNLFTLHMIETMGTSTTFANAWKEFTLDTDADVLYDETLTLGKSAGTLLALALDFTMTK